MTFFFFWLKSTAGPALQAPRYLRPDWLMPHIDRFPSAISEKPVCERPETSVHLSNPKFINDLNLTAGWQVPCHIYHIALRLSHNA